MPTIKDIFHDKYKDCKIGKRLEYKLGNMANPVVYSVDCLFQGPPGRGGQHCDEFVFCDLRQNKTGIYLVERKKGSQNVQKVKGQIQGGADFVKDFLAEDRATCGQPFDFVPVWVSKRDLKKPALRELRLAKVSIRGSTNRIRHIRNKEKLPGFRS